MKCISAIVLTLRELASGHPAGRRQKKEMDSWNRPQLLLTTADPCEKCWPPPGEGPILAWL